MSRAHMYLKIPNEALFARGLITADTPAEPMERPRLWVGCEYLPHEVP